MNKKMFGYVIAILVIGTMVVMAVKSNIDKTEPIDYQADGTNSEQPKQIGLEQGNTPPDFELSTLSGEVVKLSNLKGKRVILNFWASWCGPCKAEMPHMEKYYDKYKDSANVEVIAVNMSKSERRGLEGVEEFVKAYGLTFPIPLDKDGDVEKAYSILSIPTTYMLGTDGTIKHKIVGPMDEKMMKELVENMQ